MVLKGMQAGVAAVILTVVYELGCKVLKGKAVYGNAVLMAAALSALLLFGAG